MYFLPFEFNPRHLRNPTKAKDSFKAIRKKREYYSRDYAMDNSLYCTGVELVEAIFHDHVARLVEKANEREWHGGEPVPVTGL